jgi:hypothetical protein
MRLVDLGYCVRPVETYTADDLHTALLRALERKRLREARQTARQATERFLPRKIYIEDDALTACNE